MKFSKITRHLNMKDVNRKQLQKEEALKEEPTNSTSNVYPETSEVPNQDLIDFEAIMTGGQRLGFSGADGNTAGGAIIGTLEPPHFQAGLEGVALSPPHPVTGLRISAVHVRDGTGGTTPLRPGVTISRGFSDNAPQYTMGSVLWFYDMDFDNGVGQPAGKWCNLEFSNFKGETNGKWFFWDTIKPPSTLAGFYFANTDLSQHPCGDISDLIDGLNFPNGSLGPEKFPVITQKGLETEPIYPGPIANLFGLGQRALDWMKEKAQQAAEKIGEIASEIKTNVEEVIEQGIEIVSETIDINNNGEVDWNDMGRWVNEAIKSQTSDKFDLITAPLWDALPDKGQEWVRENLENVNRNILNVINNFQEKFTGDDMTTPLNWIEVFNETAQQNPFEKYDGEVDMTDATDIDTQIDLSNQTLGNEQVQNYTQKYNEVKGKNLPLTDAQKNQLGTYENFGIDISGVETQEDFYKLALLERFNELIGSHDSGAIGSSEQLRNTMGGRPGTWVRPEDIDNYLETGELDIHKGIQSEDAGYQFRQNTVDLPDWMDFMTGVADINPDTVGSGSVVNFFGALAVGKLGLNPRLPEDSTGSQSQDLEETPPVPWKYTIKPVESIQENSLYNSPNFLLESKRRIEKRKKQKSKFGLEIGGFDGNMRPLTGKRKKNFNLVIPKKHRHKFNKKKSGSLKESLNESVKLGHFEPDVLDVDINDIRKGIMPEYPKQPPAEMIDGYHQKSPLRPKPLDNVPYVKITKVDLIRNHRIKQSEVDEMMDTINLLNDYIKKHPEDLIYAQQRYPKDDPRLAELNWKMDQMLGASEDYLEKNFKENKKLFNRVVDRTKKNIKLTDPRYVQQRYDELRGTNQKKKNDKELKNMKLKLKLKKYLPQYESKGVFKHVDSDDFKRNIK